MKRIFRWKTTLIVAHSQEDAWGILCDSALDTDKGVPGAILTMEEHEQTTRSRQLTDYDSVSAKEYLHAVDPEEILDMHGYAIPGELDHAFEKMLRPKSIALSYSIQGEANQFAKFLQVGWICDLSDI